MRSVRSLTQDIIFVYKNNGGGGNRTRVRGTHPYNLYKLILPFVSHLKERWKKGYPSGQAEFFSPRGLQPLR